MKKTSKLLSLSSISAAVLVSTFVTMPQTALACGEDAYIGQICIMAGSYCPRNTVEPMGQLALIGDNQALFALISCTYGGDCRTTMAYPDLRGRAPAGIGQGPGLTEFSVGAIYGRELITQTIEQMPSHNHEAQFTPSGGATGGGTATGVVSLPVTGSAKIATSDTSASSSQTPSDHAVLGKAAKGLTNVELYSSAGTTADLNIGPAGAVTGTASGTISLPVTGGGSSSGTVEIGDTGGGKAMPIMGPRIAMRYCMVTNGIFPPRNY
ncbi:phage tail protein [Marinomonas shanghaiensis]|uniref:phage tail protein n=1 Tax=Marinomonas shanghaiensis TaxID=2202418 RepID=UPI001E357DC3|nr:tail fiber protein [Marinomonas shanghaiensis]